MRLALPLVAATAAALLPRSLAAQLALPTDQQGDERISAQSLLEVYGFDVFCRAGRLNWRVDRHTAISGRCTASDPLPRLDRVHVLSDGRELLLVLGTGPFIARTGAILYLDEDARPKLHVIPLPGLDSFGEVRAVDRIVTLNAAIGPNACGPMTYRSELSLDWTHNRVSQTRPLGRATGRC